MLCARHTVEEWRTLNAVRLHSSRLNGPRTVGLIHALIAAIEARDAALLHYNVEDIVRKPPPCPRCAEER